MDRKWLKYLVNVAEDSLLNALVFDNLTENTTITTPDDQHLLGVGVRVHGQVSDHLLVGELITLGSLDDIIQHEHVAVVSGLEDEHILVQALLVVEDLLDLEGHSLAYTTGTVQGQRDARLAVSSSRRG